MWMMSIGLVVRITGLNVTLVEGNATYTACPETSVMCSSGMEILS